MNPVPRVLIVEDDPELGPLLVELLTGAFEPVLAADGHRGLHQGLTGDWSVMVIDRGLPGLDGLELISTLRGRGVATPILVLTALGSVRDTIEGLDAGANDYLVKPFDVDELAARLRALTRATVTRAPALLAVGEWDLDPASRLLVSPYGDRVDLSPAESRLLAVLAGEPARVFTRGELLASAFDPGDTPGIVDTYVHHLRKKTMKSIIRTVHGAGYQVGEPI